MKSNKFLVLVLVLVAMSLAAPQSKAASIFVGDCVEYAACWSSGSLTPWSDTLTLGDLTSLGLGTDTPFIVAQTSAYVIRLGVTTMTFDTSSGPVTETLGEFNGIGDYSDPCPAPYCEVDTVGTFAIPSDALDATISGTFGNSVVPNSAGECLFLGSDSAGCPETKTAPEPATLTLIGIGLLGLAPTLRRRLSI